MLPRLRSDAAGLPLPPEDAPAPDGRVLALPLPAEMDVVRRRDAGLGMAWRMYMRAALEGAFAAGYTIVDCVEMGEHGWRYVLVGGRNDGRQAHGI